MIKKNSTIGLNYFLIKTSLFEEKAITKLCYRGSGAQSAAIYITILCFLYKKGYYIHDSEELRNEIVNKANGMFTIEELQMTIQLSISINLFDRDIYENYHVLTSKEIQECYLLSYPSRKKPSIIEYNLITNPVNVEEMYISSEETILLRKIEQ